MDREKAPGIQIVVPQPDQALTVQLTKKMGKNPDIKHNMKKQNKKNFSFDLT